jgi:hypothetical protein
MTILTADSRPASRREPWLAVAAIAAGPLVVLAAIVLTLGGWAVGRMPWWPVPEVTLPEAVAMSDSGEALRLLRGGADPDAVATVRAGVITSETLALRPLEAAVVIRRAQMVDLLLREGAAVSEGPWRDSLICRAAAEGADDVVALLLVTGEESDPRDSCADGS